MQVLNEIQSKHLKTGQDLVTEFLKRVDSTTVHANVKVIVFDTYDTTQSLKDKTRISRKKQKPVPPWNFIILLETDIEKVRMDELLASKTTKHSITQFLVQQTIDHMKKNRIDYVIAGNRATHMKKQTFFW